MPWQNVFKTKQLHEVSSGRQMHGQRQQQKLYKKLNILLELKIVQSRPRVLVVEFQRAFCLVLLSLY